MAERGEHELSFERTMQQIGQVPQILQTLLNAHVSSARQRITATSSYSFVSPSYIGSKSTIQAFVIIDKYNKEKETSQNKDMSLRKR